MILHYKLSGYLGYEAIQQYDKATTSAATGTQQAQIYTSILGIYVYFLLMMKMQ